MTVTSTKIKVIPDASVLLKWVLPPEGEPYSEQAQAISKALYDNKIELLLPALWVYEVGNVLAIKYPEFAQALLAHLVNLAIPIVQPSVRLIELTTKLVIEHSVTFYDASYHALAMTTDAIFVTADEKYLRKVSDDLYCQHIRDWK